MPPTPPPPRPESSKTCRKARLDVTQAKANLDVAQAVFDSRQNLLQQGAIPKRDLDTARASLVQAKATYDIANQHLTSLNSVSQTATIANAEGLRESAKGKVRSRRGRTRLLRDSFPHRWHRHRSPSLRR